MSDHLPSHDTFADAYGALLADVLSDGKDVEGTSNPASVGSRFGADPRSFRELVAYAFGVNQPEACLVRAASRAMNLEYVIAQWTWVMSGSDDVAAISYYNPRGWDFTEDRQSLRGAFGYRLRRAEGIDQIERVLHRLRRDPSSRREIAIVSLPSDLKRDIRDQPCLVSLQFLIRKDALELIVFMRSQSAALVLPYDASLFMMLQCWMASRLGLRAGRYTHFCGSLHIYHDEMQLADAVAAGTRQSVSINEMPNPDAGVEELVTFEKSLRSAVLAMDRQAVAKLSRALPARAGNFFLDAKKLLATGAARRLDCTALAAELQSGLPVGWQALLEDSSKTPAYRPTIR